MNLGPRRTGGGHPGNPTHSRGPGASRLAGSRGLGLLAAAPVRPEQGDVPLPPPAPRFFFREAGVGWGSVHMIIWAASGIWLFFPLTFSIRLLLVIEKLLICVG